MKRQIVRVRPDSTTDFVMSADEEKNEKLFAFAEFFAEHPYSHDLFSDAVNLHGMVVLELYLEVDGGPAVLLDDSVSSAVEWGEGCDDYVEDWDREGRQIHRACKAFLLEHELHSRAGWSGRKDYDLALLIGAKHGSLAVVEEAVANGADVRFRDRIDRVGAVVYAAKNGHLDVVKELVAAGGGDGPQASGAVMFAASSGHLEVVRYLLDHVPALARELDDALVLAACKNHVKVLALLIDRGADVHAQDDKALKSAIRYNQTEAGRCLLTRGTWFEERLTADPAIKAFHRRWSAQPSPARPATPAPAPPAVVADAGTLQPGEVLRSNGWGWILYKRPGGLELEVLMGGMAFAEKTVRLTPAEAQLFAEGGRDYIEGLASRIRNRPGEFEARFLS